MAHNERQPIPILRDLDPHDTEVVDVPIESCVVCRGAIGRIFGDHGLRGRTCERCVLPIDPALLVMTDEEGEAYLRAEHTPLYSEILHAERIIDRAYRALHGADFEIDPVSKREAARKYLELERTGR